MTRCLNSLGECLSLNNPIILISYILYYVQLLSTIWDARIFLVIISSDEFFRKSKSSYFAVFQLKRIGVEGKCKSPPSGGNASFPGEILAPKYYQFNSVIASVSSSIFASFLQPSRIFPQNIVKVHPSRRGKLN